MEPQLPAEQPVLAPLQQAFNALTPHFVSLIHDPDQDMALVMTLACAIEWVCYATPQVRVMEPHYVSGGVLVRLVVVPGASVDDLFGHAATLVSQNLRIEERRQEIQQLQEQAQQKLRVEITELMAKTGGYELAQRAPVAPAPVAELAHAPQADYSVGYQPPVAARRGPEVQTLPGRPDVQVVVRELEDVDPTPGSGQHPGGPAPSLAELARQH